MATAPTPTKATAPNRSGVVQPAAPRNGFDEAAAAIEKAEAARKAQEAKEHTDSVSGLPASTLAEMNAGKDALARHEAARKA